MVPAPEVCEARRALLKGTAGVSCLSPPHGLSAETQRRLDQWGPLEGGKLSRKTLKKSVIGGDLVVRVTFTS